MDEIGLAAEEGGGLQYINHARHLCHIGFAMDIGQHRHTDLRAHGFKNLQAAVDTGTAHRLAGATVGLVVRGLENVRNSEFTADGLHVASDIDAELLRFGGTRPGDQEKRLVKTSLETAEFH